MRISRRAALKTLTLSGLGVVGGTGVYGYAYERHALGVTRATIPVAGLSPPLSGLRIGLITDVHRSRWVSHDDVIAADGAGEERQRCRIVKNRIVPELTRDLRRQLGHLALQAERAPDPATRRYWIDLAMCWQLLERRQKR